VTLTVVIPALNAEACLGRCLDALTAADRVVVADGGSRDGTVALARAKGALVVEGAHGRGAQLHAAAAAVTTDWMLFLHADTVLDPGWRAAVDAFMHDPTNRLRAAAFVFAVDDGSARARRLERMVAWRSRVMALPYGDQGLLISRAFYNALGGYRPMPLMEDVDLVRRIGRARLTLLPVRAVTSADKWRRDGWTVRSARNIACLGMYLAGMPPRLIVRVYGR
jgi:rSAM/selenodomain-associated transferase 2